MGRFETEEASSTLAGFGDLEGDGLRFWGDSERVPFEVLFDMLTRTAGFLAVSSVFVPSAGASFVFCVCSPSIRSVLGRLSSLDEARPSAVNGGLGGGFIVAVDCRFACVSAPFPAIDFSFCRSVGSGVKTFLRSGEATFSLLPTASRLCALEKEGYGRLVLLPFGETEDARR